ncbi:MAG: hypothetical protein LBI42_05350 [Chitinispirillales bacterium]|jgi:hypothetical protein|nr:hypothetical protein [Chitinispirillales bacterium]
MTGNQQKLIEFVTADVVSFIVDDKNVSVAEAMDIVYNSTFFGKLNDVETGMYRESAGYNYELLKDELANGKFVQLEE